jgi:hypothetical protein
VNERVLVDGVRAYYEAWRDGVQIHYGNLPTWEQLSAEQMRAWMLSAAASLELGVRLGDACVSVITT